MHFDGSAESIADSDLEDGELQKDADFTTVPRELRGNPMQWSCRRERVSAQLTQAGKESVRSHSSEGQKGSGKPDAWLSSSVFRNANPSNLRGSLLEGNKHHLLNQARSDLEKQELHVESVNKCIGELQRQTEEQRLAPQDAQYGYVESRREQARLREDLSMKEKVLRNTQIDEVSVQKSR